jgi:tetrathionate reductase subunit C
MLYTGTEVAVLKYRLLWHTEWLPVKLVISGLFAAETY